MTGFTYRTLGDPIAQGSKNLARNRKGDVVGMRESGATKLRPWRKALAEDARRAHHAAGNTGPLAGALEVWIDLYLKRPGGRRHAIWGIAYPDIDKATRAVLDALKVAGAIKDDNRVARLHVQKILSDDWIGALVRVQELVDDVRDPIGQLELQEATT